VLLRLSAEGERQDERPPVNLALVIDRSSSMRGPRISQALRAAADLLARLLPHDRLSIVTFDAAPQILCPPTSVTEDNRDGLLRLLSGLQTGVGTNLAAGIRAGSDLIRSSFVRGAIPRLLLLTDGQPSIGITDSAQLCAIVEQERERGVTTTTMGLGEGFDDELLAELARRGRGGYYYLATPADISAAFGHELDGVFAIAARQTEVKLLPHADIESVELLHRLPCRSLEDGLIIEVGDVAADAPRQVLFKLTRNADADGENGGTVTVTHKDREGTAGDPHIAGIELKNEGADEVVAERLRLRVASVVDTAWARRAGGHSGQALLALREVRTEVEKACEARAAPQAALDELLEDLNSAEKAIAEGASERERVRRGMREKSQVTLLGKSVLHRLSPRDED
jgi:Ca-activated chloride channel family protein